MDWSKQEREKMWAAYAEDATTGPYRVAHGYDEARTIMADWMKLNPWFRERFNTEANRELILKEMEERHYKVALVSIQATTTSLLAQGLLRPTPVSKPTTQPEEQAAPQASEELRSWVNGTYNTTPALDLKFKLQRDPAFKKTFDAAVAAGLI